MPLREPLYPVSWLIHGVVSHKSCSRLDRPRPLYCPRSTLACIMQPPSCTPRLLQHLDLSLVSNES